MVVIALELAGDALGGGAALDTSVKADPSVVRGLLAKALRSSMVRLGSIMSALLLASAGYTTLAAGMLRRVDRLGGLRQHSL